MEGKDPALLAAGVLDEAAARNALVVFTHAPIPDVGRVEPAGRELAVDAGVSGSCARSARTRCGA